MLQNASFLAIAAVHTAENEPSKVWQAASLRPPLWGRINSRGHSTAVAPPELHSTLVELRLWTLTNWTLTKISKKSTLNAIELPSSMESRRARSSQSNCVLTCRKKTALLFLNDSQAKRRKVQFRQTGRSSVTASKEPAR